MEMAGPWPSRPIGWAWIDRFGSRLLTAGRSRSSRTRSANPPPGRGCYWDEDTCFCTLAADTVLAYPDWGGGRESTRPASCTPRRDVCSANQWRATVRKARKLLRDFNGDHVEAAARRPIEGGGVNRALPRSGNWHCYLAFLRWPLTRGTSAACVSAPGPSSAAGRKERVPVALDRVLVDEVSADHITGEHMRHGTRLLRWRTDKPPESCTMDQIR